MSLKLANKFFGIHPPIILVFNPNHCNLKLRTLHFIDLSSGLRTICFGDIELFLCRRESRQLWNEAGLQYEEENEKDLKDKLDFIQPLPALYPDGGRLPLLRFHPVKMVKMFTQ